MKIGGKLLERKTGGRSRYWQVFWLCFAVAAALFLQGKLPFLEIGTLVAYAMERMGRGEPRDLQDICRLDAQARQLAREKAAQLERVWR